MGLFDWFKKLLGGGLPQPKKAPPSPAKPPGGVRAASPPKPSVPAADYDAGDFAPIRDKDLRAASKTAEARTSPWWGRTDTIPPGDDARTKLIDRALVTRGYLTPEQLVDIHTVGDRMLA